MVECKDTGLDTTVLTSVTTTRTHTTIRGRWWGSSVWYAHTSHTVAREDAAVDAL